MDLNKTDHKSASYYLASRLRVSDAREILLEKFPCKSKLKSLTFIKKDNDKNEFVVYSSEHGKAVTDGVKFAVEIYNNIDLGGAENG